MKRLFCSFVRLIFLLEMNRLLLNLNDNKLVIEQNMTYAQTCMGFILGYVLVAFVQLPFQEH